nr:hypothetical protein [Alloalcanivorax balearicus]
MQLLELIDAVQQLLGEGELPAAAQQGLAALVFRGVVAVIIHYLAGQGLPLASVVKGLHGLLPARQYGQDLIANWRQISVITSQSVQTQRVVPLFVRWQGGQHGLIVIPDLFAEGRRGGRRRSGDDRRRTDQRRRQGNKNEQGVQAEAGHGTPSGWHPGDRGYKVLVPPPGASSQ